MEMPRGCLPGDLLRIEVGHGRSLGGSGCRCSGRSGRGGRWGDHDTPDDGDSQVPAAGGPRHQPRGRRLHRRGGIVHLLSPRFGGYSGLCAPGGDGPLHGPFRREILLFPAGMETEAVFRRFPTLHLSAAPVETLPAARRGRGVAGLDPLVHPRRSGRPDRLYLRDDGGGRRDFHGADDGACLPASASIPPRGSPCWP